MTRDVDLLGKETVFDGFSRLHRLRFRHRRHDGGWSTVMEREIFERGDAAAVLLYDPGRDEVVLLEQFRPAAYLAGDDGWQLEPVAGLIEPGETAEAVARRETREETGLALLALEPMFSYMVSPACATETVHLWCGRVAAGGIHGNAAEDEDIRLHVLGFTHLVERYQAGGFRYALTLLAVQWLLLNRDRLRRIWGA